MSRKQRPLVSVEDQALFLSALGGVTPLASRDRIAMPPPPPSAARVVEHPPTVKLAIEGDSARYLARAPGVPLTQAAELRAGKVHAELTLDLHGDTVPVALDKLRQLLAKDAARLRCVRVIHGKGTHSDHGAPLREAVLTELIGPLSGYVHALSTAPQADGGEGATLVMLKRTR